MKPHRFITAILCAMLLIGPSGAAYAVRPYTPRKAPPVYNRFPEKLASGFTLPAAKSITFERSGLVRHPRQYLQSLHSWTGLSGSDRRVNGDLSPTGAVLARSKQNYSGSRNSVNSRYLGTKVIAPRGPYTPR
jgi:hypothetical protein